MDQKRRTDAAAAKPVRQHLGRQTRPPVLPLHLRHTFYPDGMLMVNKEA